MIKAIYTAGAQSLTETQIEKLPAIVASKPRLLWVDLCIEDNELNTEEIALLRDVFKVHDLSLEDCLFPQYHPKVEEFDHYLFAAVHGIRSILRTREDFDAGIYELDLMVGEGFVITAHVGDLEIVESAFERAKMKPQVQLRSMEALLHHIIEKVVASYELTLEKLNDRIDALEDRIIANPSSELIAEILSTRKVMIDLRKLAEPQKNVYSFFARETTPFISRHSTAYFRDVFYQMERINQAISSSAQMFTGMMDVYVSGVTLKLNEVMKFLTIIATILLPAVLIASYYGMNVAFPEHRIFGVDNVWYFAMLMILISTVAVFYYIKHKKWF